MIEDSFKDKDLTEGLIIPPPPRNFGSPKKIIFEPTDKQMRYIEAAFSGLYRYLLFGGGIRSGKTYVVLSIIILLCKLFPKSRWIVVRADYDRLRRHVLPVFWKVCPPNFLDRFNQQNHTAYMKNGSEIIFFSEQYEDDPELTRWHGLEINGGVLEEADELQEATFNKFVERMGSWFMTPMPPMLCLLTCNPSNGWLKKKFYEPHVANTLQSPYFFLQALITDNPYVPQEFLDKLKDMPPELYRRFVQGSWETEDMASQLIPWGDIHAAESLIVTDDVTPYLGVDVGRFGNDASVWTLLNGPNIKEIFSLKKTSIDEVVEHTKRFIIQHRIKAEDVTIDGVGIGAGVIDFLHKEKYYVNDFVGGASPIPLLSSSEIVNFEFFNLRSQMCWQLRTDFSKKRIGGLISKYQKLKDDIGSISYSIKGDKKIAVDSKDVIREKLHRSPDDFDSLMYANTSRCRHVISSRPGFVFG